MHSRLEPWTPLPCEVDSAVSPFAKASDVELALSRKAEAWKVDAELSKKANHDYVLAELGRKPNRDYVPRECRLQWRAAGDVSQEKYPEMQ